MCEPFASRFVLRGPYASRTTAAEIVCNLQDYTAAALPDALNPVYMHTALTRTNADA